MTAATEGEALVGIDGLKVHFPITSGVMVQRKVGAVRAVDGLYDVHFRQMSKSL